MHGSMHLQERNARRLIRRAFILEKPIQISTNTGGISATAGKRPMPSAQKSRIVSDFMICRGMFLNGAMIGQQL